MAGLMIMPACYKQPIINIPEIKMPEAYQLIKKDDHFSGSDYIAIYGATVATLNFFLNVINTLINYFKKK
jgi:hypothetical protein